METKLTKDIIMNANMYENELVIGRQLEIHEMDLYSIMNQINVYSGGFKSSEGAYMAFSEKRCTGASFDGKAINDACIKVDDEMGILQTINNQFYDACVEVDDEMGILQTINNHKYDAFIDVHIYDIENAMNNIYIRDVDTIEDEEEHVQIHARSKRINVIDDSDDEDEDEEEHVQIHARSKRINVIDDSDDEDEEDSEDSDIEDQSDEAKAKRKFIFQLIKVAHDNCDSMILKDVKNGKTRLRIYSIPENVMNMLFYICITFDFTIDYKCYPRLNDLFDLTVIV